MGISLHHIRNATSILTMNGKRILIDPMLSDVGELPPIPLTFHRRRNPLTPLPVPLELFRDVDAVLITHLHFDHWDKKAIATLEKHLPVLCPPQAEARIRRSGFTQTIVIEDTLEWGGIELRRIQGNHAKGWTKSLLGAVSGFLMRTPQDGSFYLVGDCIYESVIEDTFARYQPEIAILNTAKAQMMWGTIITMTEEDILRISRLFPRTTLVAVHLEAINHCKQKREELLALVQRERLTQRVKVPANNEIIHF